ncbi:hypothetical protein LEMLEM_LOCUS17922 [Lemmus lemmus]
MGNSARCSSDLGAATNGFFIPATSWSTCQTEKVPNATKQDSAVAVLEWQRQLEAAEALLALKNSSQHPRYSASMQHPGGMPGH